MRARWVGIVVLALAGGCGDAAGRDAGPGTGLADATGADGDGDGSGDDDGEGDDGGSDADDGDGESDGDDGATDATDDGSDTEPDDSADDGGVPGAAPVELYRGTVAGAVVPGWDPDAPRPLLMMGRLGDDWIATLARIGDDGSLSQNVAEEIIVWGWDVDPTELYDGNVGGTLSPWSAGDPYPLVLVGYRESDGAWYTTLSSIDAAGTLGDNLADRLVVWGWSTGGADAPSLQYQGPVGGVLDDWSAEDPRPLVLLGRLGDTWQSTLASVSPDGTLGMNVADELLVWGW